jgi:hypothetical protein
MCKGGGHVLIKGLGLAFLGFLAFSKLNQWYQHVGEMEIILDQTDNRYTIFKLVIFFFFKCFIYMYIY